MRFSPPGSRANRTLWLLLMLLPPLFWAGNALIGRLMSGAVGPFTLSFWRWALALLLILPFTFRDILAHRDGIMRSWRVIVILGVISVGAYNSLMYVALETSSAINVTLVAVVTAPLVLLLSRVWLKEPILARQMWGIAISIGGLVVVISQGKIETLLGLTLAPGDLLMLVASLLWALYSVMLRRYRLPLRPTTLLTLLVAAGTLVILPLYLWEQSQRPVLELTTSVLSTFAYMAIFPSLLAYLLWNKGVAAIGAATVGQYSNLIPLFTTVLAILLLKEDFLWFHAIGGGLIFLGIALSSARGKKLDAPTRLSD